MTRKKVQEMTLAPEQSYHSSHTDNPRNPEERYGFKQCVGVVKEAVPVIDVADLLCGPGGLRRVNTHWIGRCPLPDHEDKTPSFVVYPGNNSWWCFGCSRGSDVLDLYQLAHGYSEKWETLVGLAQERGVKLPGRPKGWHEWQKTKTDIRNVAEAARKDIRRRRLFKCLVLTGAEFEIEDPVERRAAIKQAWQVWESGMRRIGQ
jgi:hypothetical protein